MGAVFAAQNIAGREIPRSPLSIPASYLSGPMESTQLRGLYHARKVHSLRRKEFYKGPASP